MLGKIIVFEGTDSSGKATQSRIFFNRLRESNSDCAFYSFPRYTCFFGSLVGKHLIGEFGNPHELPPEFCALLYSIDRYEIKKHIESEYFSGKTIVMDRYVHSNIVHQAAKFVDIEERQIFLKWIENLESRMPQADAVVFLNMPTQAAQSLMQGNDRKESYRKGSKKDLHESNAQYLERTRKVYAELAQKYNWIVVNCAVFEKGKWKVKSKEEIHSEIWQKLEPILKQ